MVCSGAREEAAVEKDPEPEGAAWRRRWQPRGERGGGGILVCVTVTSLKL